MPSVCCDPDHVFHGTVFRDRYDAIVRARMLAYIQSRFAVWFNSALPPLLPYSPPAPTQLDDLQAPVPLHARQPLNHGSFAGNSVAGDCSDLAPVDLLPHDGRHGACFGWCSPAAPCRFLHLACAPDWCGRGVLCDPLDH
ncbi:hypothetical protein BT67DRAFT_455762 [Trichocladium antarcticum]|uniref:Uncharacterized protein n=1 Tax=Trichocladium antarcticum TaxID=1450529 RepID=A0AAN6ULZ9_9PEZI|nr:hypothetical protein BT67DRAFT_455762 [Trichocladium antarcticum]